MEMWDEAVVRAIIQSDGSFFCCSWIFGLNGQLTWFARIFSRNILSFHGTWRFDPDRYFFAVLSRSGPFWRTYELPMVNYVPQHWTLDEANPGSQKTTQWCSRKDLRFHALNSPKGDMSNLGRNERHGLIFDFLLWPWNRSKQTSWQTKTERKKKRLPWASKEPMILKQIACFCMAPRGPHNKPSNPRKRVPRRSCQNHIEVKRETLFLACNTKYGRNRERGLLEIWNLNSSLDRER